MPTPLNRAKKEEIAKKVLMPGDPLHAKIIAQSVWSESSYARTQNGYEVDKNLGILLEELREDDLLILTADHGNDPTYTGTDHTREYVPFLAYSKAMKEGGKIPEQDTFAVIGATIAENFEVEMSEGTIGTSILAKLR